LTLLRKDIIRFMRTERKKKREKERKKDGEQERKRER
jgi:hypothetical protein